LFCKNVIICCNYAVLLSFFSHSYFTLDCILYLLFILEKKIYINIWLHRYMFISCWTAKNLKRTINILYLLAGRLFVFLDIVMKGVFVLFCFVGFFPIELCKLRLFSMWIIMLVVILTVSSRLNGSNVCFLVVVFFS
jgi:hypothetical protein